jgi:tetraacyldisaccharide 4'-kinase
MGASRRQALERALLRTWRTRGLAAWLLWPLSLIFRALTQARRALYDEGILSSQSVRVPVVVVGNVVAGGAGKTPVVIALVEHLQQRGLQVGVVSRGYGRRSAGCTEVRIDSPATEVGDEPALIKHRTGAAVFVASRRFEAAQALLRHYPQTQVIVADDGLQHLALRRDIEVCVFDDRGIGNGLLLPAGPLREPWPRAVDFVLHSGTRPAFAGHAARRELAGHAQRADGSRLALADLRGHPVAALAGIAQPNEFFAMLRAQGLVLASATALPDHYDYRDLPAEITAPEVLVCTEKDAVKLWARHPRAWAVPLVVTLEPAFLAALDAKLEAQLSLTHGHQTS